MAHLRRFRFWGIALLGAAVLAPPAGMQLRILLETLVGPPPGRADRTSIWDWSSRRAGPTPAQVAAQMPDDAAVQLLALDSEASVWGSAKSESIRRLVARFPSDPLLRASLVQQQLGECRLDRPDLAWHLVAAPGYRRRSPGAISVGAARLQADATVAERMDPTNALFPVARASALYMMRRDHEAVAALRAVGRSTTWRDYREVRSAAAMRLFGARMGPTSSTERTAVQAGALADDFPVNAHIRNLTRIGVGQAIQLERAGRSREALAIRMALLRVGGLMRRDGTELITSLVGIAVEAIAMSDGRGRQSARKLSSAEMLQREARLLSAMESRLMDAQRSDTVPALAEARRASLETRDVARVAMERDAGGFARTMAVLGLFSVSEYMLLGMVWLGMLWCLGAIRSFRGRRTAWVVGIVAVLVTLLVELRGAMRIASFALPEVLSKAAGFDEHLRALLVGALTLALPLLALLIAVIVRWRKRDAFSDCLRQTSQWMLAVSAVVFVGMLWTLATWDRAASARLDAALRHEGRAYAAAIGRKWPEAVAPGLTGQ